MKEELKQAIESYYPEVDAFGYTRPNYSHFRKAAKDALLNPDFLLHADPEIMKQAGWVREEEWISVNDDLPEFGQEVSVVVSNMGKVYVTSLARFTSYEGCETYYWDNAYPGRGNLHLPEIITHWKPLPQPPKQ